jgi:aspartyl-tRNA(Asn)/glutamyl-tRNA(Gln) amidotransferase subunit B
MEEGSLRCDANVSVRPQGSSGLGVKTELKNLNSFKAVEKALEHEIQRQIATLLDGGKINQETRLWDADREATLPMRSKEHAHDYRYFPDPDLPPLVIDEKWIDEIKSHLPELPDARRERFLSQYRLPPYDADLLIGRKDVADYFEAAVKSHPNPKAVGNWVIGDLFRVIKERRLDQALRITTWPIPPDHLAGLVRLIDEDTISGKMAKNLFDEMLARGEPPTQIVQEKGLQQVTDMGIIERVVDQVLAKHPQQVSDYRAGNEKIFGFLVGQVMKAGQGKVNPRKVNEILQTKLRQDS